MRQKYYRKQREKRVNQIETISKELLVSQVLEAINCNNMLASIRRYNELYRYTGTPDGEAAVDYIMDKMSEYGIPAKRIKYDAYLSLPLSAHVDMIFPDKKRYKVIAGVFSGSAKGLQGELYYDYMCTQKGLGQKQNIQRFAEFKDKIIITRDDGGDFAKTAYDAGALGVIHIWPSGEPFHHHSTIGTVWGTPVPSDAHKFPYVPFVEMTKGDGEELIGLLEKGNVTVAITTELENKIRRTSMPIVTIKGASEKYVLISGHYDSWYEGITDNAASDAILIELARIFTEKKDILKRSVVIGWWSGHSDGRYSGSTWFCDNNWEDLTKNCVAHINIDLAGCKNADQIRARTTLMEGKAFTDNLIREFTGNEPKLYIPMIRGADQSFWGNRVPISIMLKYEPLPENCDFQCPSGGAWWHTDADTIDKLDENILMRDARINAKMACLILNADHLPVDIAGYISEMESFLKNIESKLNEDFSLTLVFSHIEKLKEAVEKLAEASGTIQDTDEIVKKVAGELTRITYSYSSPYYQDSAVSSQPFPLLNKVIGLTRENTCADYYLFNKTDFIRQRNRLIGQINQVIDDIDHQIIKWQLKKSK